MVCPNCDRPITAAHQVCRCSECHTFYHLSCGRRLVMDCIKCTGTLEPYSTVQPKTQSSSRVSGAAQPVRQQSSRPQKKTSGIGWRIPIIIAAIFIFSALLYFGIMVVQNPSLIFHGGDLGQVATQVAQTSTGASNITYCGFVRDVVTNGPVKDADITIVFQTYVDLATTAANGSFLRVSPSTRQASSIQIQKKNYFEFESAIAPCKSESPQVFLLTPLPAPSPVPTRTPFPTPLSNIYTRIIEITSSGSFLPPSLLAKAGDTITWISYMENSAKPNIVSATCAETCQPNSEFQSGAIPKSGFFIKTFTKPGLYYYYSERNPTVVGVIQIVP